MYWNIPKSQMGIYSIIQCVVCIFAIFCGSIGGSQHKLKLQETQWRFDQNLLQYFRMYCNTVKGWVEKYLN